MKSFTKKELTRLKVNIANEERDLNEEEIKLILEYQKRFPILLDAENNLEFYCVDARKLWEQLECPQGQFNKWTERKFNPYGYFENVDFKAFYDRGQFCPRSFSDEEIREMSQQKMASFGISKEYMLSLDMAKGMAMIDKKECGMIARRYFILMENIARSNKDWWTIREPEKKNYKLLCEELDNYIQNASKDNRHGDKYDYMREANSINIIALGCTATDVKSHYVVSLAELTRDSLYEEYNEKIAFLQEIDILYMKSNMDYKVRMNNLIMMFDAKYPNAEPLLPFESKEDMIKKRNMLINK